MTVIHFLRHGAIDNPQNIFYGRLPGFHLNEDGKACVQYMATQLRQFAPTAIYHSPLERTAETAAIIGQTLHITPLPDERLTEVATLFEGHPRGISKQITHYPLTHYPPTTKGYAETMEEIYDRMARFMREKLVAHQGQEIIAISHGGPMRILELGLTNRPLTEAIFNQEEIPDCGVDLRVKMSGPDISVASVYL